MSKNKYNYIILGAGASGLMLACQMAQDAFFDDKSVLIIDKKQHKGNNRTWCFWEAGKGNWDTMLTQQWQHIFFGSKTFSKTIAISPYSYKMLRSKDFYQSMWQSISAKPNFTFVADEVLHFTKNNNDEVEVQTKSSTYTANKLFNSILKPEVYDSQKKYPVLQQHFVGWFIETEKPVFDDTKATFMDFSVPQNGNTRFMYVLPVSKTLALFEYTLFSKDLLPKQDYENAIKNYLEAKQITNYKIVEKEQGSIPMTTFKFTDFNSKHILNIGTAGGFTKASTGYTFKNTEKKNKQLITFLKTEKTLNKFKIQAKKYHFYDSIFLEVLAKNNKVGEVLFSSMFKQNKIATIFKFLDEESSLTDDLKIIFSIKPKRHFIKAFFRYIF